MGGLLNYDLPKRFIHIAVNRATRYVWMFVNKNETSNAYVSCPQQIMWAGKHKKLLADGGFGFIGQ